MNKESRQRKNKRRKAHALQATPSTRREGPKIWDPLREWYGSAVYGDEFHHADMRAVDNSIQMTLLPAVTKEGPLIWQLRLRGGEGEIEKMATALATGDRYIWAQDNYEALVYLPEWPNEELGTLGRVRIDPSAEEPPEELDFIRRKEFPLPFFEEMGRNLQTISGALDPSISHDGWEPETHHFCDGCDRPVFDSMPTGMVMTGSSPPIASVCPLCLHGKILEMVRQGEVIIPAPRLAVLESIAATMAD